MYTRGLKRLHIAESTLKEKKVKSISVKWTVQKERKLIKKYLCSTFCLKKEDTKLQKTDSELGVFFSFRDKSLKTFN